MHLFNTVDWSMISDNDSEQMFVVITLLFNMNQKYEINLSKLQFDRQIGTVFRIFFVCQNIISCGHLCEYNITGVNQVRQKIFCPAFWTFSWTNVSFHCSKVCFFYENTWETRPILFHWFQWAVFVIFWMNQFPKYVLKKK